MKIINNNECYVQREDIEYILDNSNNVPSELFFELNMSIIGDRDFIKIENPVSLRFILQSQIPTFDELNSYSTNKLEEFIIKLKLSIFDSDDELTSEELKDIDKMILERRNREYLLRQLKEMVAFKKRTSKLTYPNIPNPNYSCVTNGILNAYNSMNPDKIVVYSIDGGSVSEEDMAFCETAYQLLMHDYEDTEEISLNIINEGKYLVIENNNQKYLRRKFMK